MEPSSSSSHGHAAGGIQVEIQGTFGLIFFILGVACGNARDAPDVYHLSDVLEHGLFTLIHDEVVPRKRRIQQQGENYLSTERQEPHRKHLSRGIVNDEHAKTHQIVRRKRQSPISQLYSFSHPYHESQHVMAWGIPRFLKPAWHPVLFLTNSMQSSQSFHNSVCSKDSCSSNRATSSNQSRGHTTRNTEPRRGEVVLHY